MFLVIGVLLGLISCDRPEEIPYQLVLANASVIDSVTGEVKTNKTLFVRSGKIVEIAGSKEQDTKRKITIDINGRLVTPSFIDVHNHLNFVYGRSNIITNPEKFTSMHSLLTNQYLP